MHQRYTGPYPADFPTLDPPLSVVPGQVVDRKGPALISPQFEKTDDPVTPLDEIGQPVPDEAASPGQPVGDVSPGAGDHADPRRDVGEHDTGDRVDEADSGDDVDEADEHDADGDAGEDTSSDKQQATGRAAGRAKGGASR